MIILAEIGRGGLNQAVIGIEQTKAKLQAAVDDLSGPTGSGEPATSPAPSPSPSATCDPPRADRPRRVAALRPQRPLHCGDGPGRIARARAATQLRRAHPVQLRVVTDQPWDVPADVLVIPIVGEPAFDGPLGELNRRSGGELAALGVRRAPGQAIYLGARRAGREPRGDVS